MKNFIISLLVVISLFVIKFYNFYPIQLLEMKSLDLVLTSSEQKTYDDVVIIEISDKTLDKLGQWPLSRDKFAQMIEFLRTNDAGLIALPILFSEPDRMGHDSAFAEALSSGGTIIAQTPTNQTRKPDAVRRGFAAIGLDPGPYAFSWPGAVSPLGDLASAASGVGVLASAAEVDGVVRRMPMVVRIAGGLYPSFPLETIRVATDDPSFQIKTGDAGIEAVRILQFKTVETDANGRIWLDWSYKFKTVDWLDVKKQDVEGKLVIISPTASGVATIIATPRGEQYAHVVQAIALTSLIEGTTPVRLNYANFVELAAFTLLALLIVIFAPKLPPKLTVPTFVVVVGAIGYLPKYMFDNYQQLWDVSYIILANSLIFGLIIANSLVREYMQKLQIKKQFGTYLSPAMVEKLQENPDLLKLGGETRELSIMFTDVRGFTAISEHYGANVQGLTQIMNRYMTAMTGKILENNGTLDKYIGDAQMAFWNAPLDDAQHAKNAVRTAMAMLGDLDRFNEEVGKEGVPPFGMGLGINTGSVVVGNMGSTQRFDYTCLGDSVNLASRLEGQSKNYGVKIIIGPITAEQVKDEFAVFELDEIAVKGKKEGVKIYTVLDWADMNKGYVQTHNEFLDYYRKGQWDSALIYAKGLTYSFNGKMSDYYDMMIERIKEYKQSPPKNWDGVYRATSK